MFPSSLHVTVPFPMAHFHTPFSFLIAMPAFFAILSQRSSKVSEGKLERRVENNTFASTITKPDRTNEPLRKLKITLQNYGIFLIKIIYNSNLILSVQTKVPRGRGERKSVPNQTFSRCVRSKPNRRDLPREIRGPKFATRKERNYHGVNYAYPFRY